MREIKFRAWDNKQKKIIYFPLSLMKEFIGWELMQFTGLLDRNGKEIFEGDVVEMRDGARNPYTVIWADSFNGFGLDGVPGGLQILLKEYIVDITIIGNIYENPDLIN